LTSVSITVPRSVARRIREEAEKLGISVRVLVRACDSGSRP